MCVTTIAQSGNSISGAKESVGVTGQAQRPVTFSYNGGPGNSSLWLHMGVLGPKRVSVNDPQPNGPAPYKIKDNN